MTVVERDVFRTALPSPKKKLLRDNFQSWNRFVIYFLAIEAPTLNSPPALVSD